MDDTGEAVLIALRDVPTAWRGDLTLARGCCGPAFGSIAQRSRISARTSGLRRMASTEIACFGLVERPRN